MIRLLLGLLAASSFVALSPGVSSAVTFNWTTGCDQVVLGPITVLSTAGGFNGTVDLTLNVPVTVALLPIANVLRRDNPAAPPGTHTAVLSCSLTFGGVTVPFTRSLTLVVNAVGNGDLTVGAVSVFVNLGPAVGTVILSAPAFTSIGYDPAIPIIVIPLPNNTTALLSPPGIPTLSTWAMMVLVMAMLGAGLVFLRRGPQRV